MSESFKTPDFKVTKNGYEIRADILKLAQNIVAQEYSAKVGQFEFSMKKEGNEFVTKVEFPPYPGIAEVLATADKLYEFVNKKN